jgi:hypothetical protein
LEDVCSANAAPSQTVGAAINAATGKFDAAATRRLDSATNPALDVQALCRKFPNASDHSPGIALLDP